jgi:hypothetical protein
MMVEMETCMVKERTTCMAGHGGQHILCIAFCVALRTWVGPFELGCARGSGGGFAVAVENLAKSQEKVCHRRRVTIIHDLCLRTNVLRPNPHQIPVANGQHVEWRRSWAI